MVRKEMRSRHRRMLQRFVTDPEPLLALMRLTNTIISGSLALQYFEGDHRWTGKDLDLYTPRDNHAEVVEFFRSVGYRDPEITCPRAKENPRVFKKNRLVRHAFTLCHD